MLNWALEMDGLISHAPGSERHDYCELGFNNLCGVQYVWVMVTEMREHIFTYLSHLEEIENIFNNDFIKSNELPISKAHYCAEGQH